MAEYIERETAIDAIMKVYVRTAGYKARERVFEAEEAVHRLPVADVAPVVHGRWLCGEDYMFCSKCGMQWNYCDNDTQDFKFCPNCGAKMDGGDKDATDAFDAFDDALQDALTIDAVPVVRCRDCRYYRESRVLAPNKFCFRLNHPTEPGKIGYNFADDDFCSRGVRKVVDNAEG